MNLQDAIKECMDNTSAIQIRRAVSLGHEAIFTKDFMENNKEEYAYSLGDVMATNWEVISKEYEWIWYAYDLTANNYCIYSCAHKTEKEIQQIVKDHPMFSHTRIPETKRIRK
jgi:hypothetical protein